MIKCKFYNRGYCKEKDSCEFVHPEETCQEFIDTGYCSAGRLCHGRHPHKCRFWQEGSCHRDSSCAFQHQEFDRPAQVIEEVNDEDNENDEEGDDTTSNNETEHEPESTEENNYYTTDEIIEMYENMSEEELFAKPLKMKKKSTKKDIAKKSFTKPKV
jgi:hypothetical protein